MEIARKWGWNLIIWIRLKAKAIVCCSTSECDMYCTPSGVANSRKLNNFSTVNFCRFYHLELHTHTHIYICLIKTIFFQILLHHSFRFCHLEILGVIKHSFLGLPPLDHGTFIKVRDLPPCLVELNLANNDIRDAGSLVVAMWLLNFNI